MLRATMFLTAISLCLSIVGCGGADGPVPDVTGKRLDVAKSELKDAGFDTEEIGGGTFGIVAESNWTVCETEPGPGESGGGKVKLIVDRECSDSAGSASETSEAAANGTPEDESEEPAATEDAVERARVPDVRGMNHQAAQNRMQDAGLYNLREEDATGQGRLLLYDRNWVVVNQRPRPGARVSPERAVTLYSKKRGE